MTSQRVLLAAFLLAIILGAAAPAAAYVGPGAGLSLLGALWGLLLSIGAALGFIILWPLRRLRQRREKAAGQAAEQPSSDRK
ncbi:MAG: hypothetical protein M0017_05075 [Desulfobacteraceae bacterium]|nr:hypothetical protein [Desulfobacteraceae bacterium]